MRAATDRRANLSLVEQKPHPLAPRASMPRKQRPLVAPSASAQFWPEDGAGWLLVQVLAVTDLALLGFLVKQIFWRH